MNEDDMRRIVQDELQRYTTANQYNVSPTSAHTHNGTDSLQVDGASLMLTDVTTNNVSTLHHGFVPKAPNNAAKYLDGTGAFTVPAASSGTVTEFDFTNGNGFAGIVSSPTSTPTLTIFLAGRTGILYSSDGVGILATAVASDSTYFLNGATTPVYAKVKDSDLSTSDITTNDATTSKHGFLQKLPGGTTTFLRADGSFAAPTAGLITWKGNSGSHTASAGNITIAHGLGVTPAVFEISAYANGTGSIQLSSNGTYDGTTNSCSYMYYTGSGQGVGNKTTRCIFLDNGGTQAEFTATWDATNVTLTANTDNVTFSYNWRAS